MLLRGPGRRRSPRPPWARPCEDVDARRPPVIADAGYGEYFIHRTGHGIGVEAHEDPYIVEGNTAPLVAGHAFSIEPGIYIPGRWGARLEDIVVATADGPARSTRSTTASSSSTPERGDRRPMAFDGATFLLQWATGGLLFLWVTTRRREVGLGYGWLMRGIYAPDGRRRAPTSASASSTRCRSATSRRSAWRSPRSVALAVSIVRRKAPACPGSGELAEAPLGPGGGHDRHRPRRRPSTTTTAAGVPARRSTWSPRSSARVGIVGSAASTRSTRRWLAVARLLVGAAFLGAVTDAMLLGHWYLVQPGLAAGAAARAGPLDRGALGARGAAAAGAVGMVSVLNGTIDDGYGGLLGWFWLACAVTTGRPAGRHPAGPEGAGVLGGHGRHRPALPGHPHRLRHRPRRPRPALGH